MIEEEEASLKFARWMRDGMDFILGETLLVLIGGNLNLFGGGMCIFFIKIDMRSSFYLWMEWDAKMDSNGMFLFPQFF